MSIPSDTERLDWLERNLESIYRFSNPQMGGQVFGGTLNNERWDGGPTRLRVNHSTIRAAVDEAMVWVNPKAQS